MCVVFFYYDAFRYREAGVLEWSTIPVTPSGSTQVTINRLTPDTTYEFQVVGKNALGDGMLSKVISIKTLGELTRKRFTKTERRNNNNNNTVFSNYIINTCFICIFFLRLTGVGNTVSVV